MNKFQYIIGKKRFFAIFLLVIFLNIPTTTDAWWFGSQSASVEQSDTSFFASLWCSARSVFNQDHRCRQEQAVAVVKAASTTSVMVTSDSEPDTATPASTPDATNITNQYITNPTTIIREVVRETIPTPATVVYRSGGGGSFDGDNFVSRTLFANQVDRIYDSISSRASGSGESFSTDLLTVSGNGSVANNFTVAGDTTLSTLAVTSTTTLDNLVATEINLSSGTPADTTNRLYNTNGSLYWNGSLVTSSSTGNWSGSGSDVYRLSGNVGIGTSTLNSLLSLQTTGTKDILNLFETGGSEVFTVLESGRVGIGTISPVASLEVAGGDIALNSNYIGNDGDGTGLSFNNGGASFTNISGSMLSYNFQNTSNANNSGSRLVFESGPSIEMAQIEATVDTNTQNSRLTFGVRGSNSLDEVARFDSSGNFGIGTTTPDYLLTVDGTASFSDLTGSTGAGSLCLTANNEVVFNSASDACLPSLRQTKHDITTLDFTALDLIGGLETVSFVYNQGDGRTRYGFIAEDVATVDELLATYDADGQISGIDDRSMIAVTLKAVQELWSQTKEYFDRTETLEAEVESLKARLDALESKNAKQINQDEEIDSSESEEESEEESDEEEMVDAAVAETEETAATENDTEPESTPEQNEPEDQEEDEVEKGEEVEEISPEIDGSATEPETEDQ